MRMLFCHVSYVIVLTRLALEKLCIPYNVRMYMHMYVCMYYVYICIHIHFDLIHPA
jgi:hypothetical protein